MWIPSVTLLGFLGVSLSSCPLGLEKCNEHPPAPPQIWLLRSPFCISLAPGKLEGSQKLPNLESITIIFPAGAGMDNSGGGFHARVATRVAAALLTYHSPGFLFPGCAAKVCGSTAILQLRYPPALRRAMLESLTQLIRGSIPNDLIVAAIKAERDRSMNFFCPCLGDTACSHLHQVIAQGIEAFDPLPGGATRRGNRLLLHRVNPDSCLHWMQEQWTSAWIHLDLDLAEVHRKNRRFILADLQAGLGDPQPVEPGKLRPPVSPAFFPIFPQHSAPPSEEEWTLIELSPPSSSSTPSSSTPSSSTPSSSTPSKALFGEERVSLLRQRFPAGTDISTALMQRKADRLTLHRRACGRAPGSPPIQYPTVFDRYAASLRRSESWRDTGINRRLFIYLREGMVFCSWQ